MIKLEFPGESLVKAQVQSLIWELNSYKPCSMAKKKKKKKKVKYKNDV